MQSSKLIRYFQENMEEITQWRHDLHQNPEIAFQEYRTAKIISDRLESWGIEVHEGIANTGVVGVLKGKTNKSGSSIGLRADMDALNIEEMNIFTHKSTNKGKMHACGHDGHTTMLLAAAKRLSETRNFDGTAYFIFQPAEEDGGGGHVMIEDGLFRRFEIDRVFGMHNWPELEAGKMAICKGAMTATADEFSIIIHGKGGHAALPHLHIDSIMIASTIVLSLHGLISSNTNPLEGALIGVCQLHGGTTDSAMPQTVKLNGTVRCFNDDTREMLETNIRRISQAISLAHGATAEVIYERGYPSVINDSNEVKKAIDAAISVVGEENVEDFTPTMGGEDFSFMLQEKPGAFIALGQGNEKCGLHSPKYDFNDKVIPIGASYWTSLVEQILEKPKARTKSATRSKSMRPT